MIFQFTNFQLLHTPKSTVHNAFRASGKVAKLPRVPHSLTSSRTEECYDCTSLINRHRHFHRPTPRLRRMRTIASTTIWCPISTRLTAMRCSNYSRNAFITTERSCFPFGGKPKAQYFGNYLLPNRWRCPFLPVVPLETVRSVN